MFYALAMPTINHDPLMTKVWSICILGDLTFSFNTLFLDIHILLHFLLPTLLLEVRVFEKPWIGRLQSRILD